MKILCAAVAASIALASAGAHSASLDMSDVTCQKFLESVNSRTLPVVAGWLRGHYSAKGSPMIVDFDGADRDMNELLNFCRGNPTVTVSAAGERLFAK